MPDTIQLKPTKATCEARRDGVSYYEKTGATYALVASKARVGTWQNGTCKMLDSQTGQPGALTGIGGHATTAFGTYRAAVYARDGAGYRTVRVRTWPFLKRRRPPGQAMQDLAGVGHDQGVRVGPTASRSTSAGSR